MTRLLKNWHYVGASAQLYQVQTHWSSQNRAQEPAYESCSYERAIHHFIKMIQIKRPSIAVLYLMSHIDPNQYNSKNTSTN